MFEFLWNNGLVRAILATSVVGVTFGMAAIGEPVSPEQWTFTGLVGAFYFGTGSVKPVVGVIKDKVNGG